MRFAFFAMVTMLSGVQVVSANSTDANLEQILSSVDQFAQKLGIDVPKPLSTNHVTSFGPYEGHEQTRSILIQDRWQFVFDLNNHLIDTFCDREYSMAVLWKPAEIKPLIRPSAITKEEALKMAREYLQRLGYLEMDLPVRPPEIHQWKWEPPGTESQPLPVFTIKWPSQKHPYWAYFTMEIDGRRKMVTAFSTMYPLRDPPTPSR